MNEIEFENAPEGATHFGVSGGDIVFYRDIDRDGYECSCGVGRGWITRYGDPSANKLYPLMLKPESDPDTGETPKSSAHSILDAAASHMQDRAATYDKPEGERSMGATVGAFRAVTGHDLTEEQGWLFMALLKAVRSQQGAYRADSYEDGAAYFALAGESSARDRAEK